MFKVGDIVVCIKPSNFGAGNLPRNIPCVVIGITEFNYIKLEGRSLSYDPARFVLSCTYVQVAGDPTTSPVIKKIRLMEKRRKQYYETV